MFNSEALVGLPGFEVTEIGYEGRLVRLSVRYVGGRFCAACGSSDLRDRGRRVRHLRHESIGERCCVLELETRKLRCRVCMKTFWQRFPRDPAWKEVHGALSAHGGSPAPRRHQS